MNNDLTPYSKIEIFLVFTNSDSFASDYGYWALVLIDIGRHSHCLPGYRGKLHISNAVNLNDCAL